MANLSNKWRLLIVGVASLGLIIVFQNCGQAGSIAEVQEPLSDVNDSNVSPPPPGTTLRDYEKVVTVNQSNGQVDVLVVVDNSGSMSFEQANMGDRFANFLGRLQGLNWQVGITTTDIRMDTDNAFRKDGRLLPFDRLSKHIITSQDNQASAALAFAETIKRPAREGSSLEQGVRATYRAVERAIVDTTANTGTNRGLIRPGAALSVILVSDADETVTSNDKAGDPTTFTDRNKPEKLKEFIQTSFPGKVFKFNSIVVRDGDMACLNFPNSDNEGYGKNYQVMSTLTSGIIGSVCETDYSNQLSIIGDNTVEMVKTITLDCDPVDTNADGKPDITVTMVSNANPLVNYTVLRRVITFANNLPVGSYKVAYKCLSN